MNSAAYIRFNRELNNGKGLAELQHRLENPYKWVEYSDYDSEEFAPDACSELFNLIIKQAFTDATYNLIDHLGENKVEHLSYDWEPSHDLQTACVDAQRWFFKAGEGYRNVCYYADQDAEIIREGVLRRFEELNQILPFKWRIYQRCLL